MPTTRRRSASNSKGIDPFKLLKTDHTKVLTMLKRLETAAEKDDGKARSLMSQIDRELKIHSQIEEEIFYPAFREAARNTKERELFFEAMQEHHIVDLVVPEVSDNSGPEDFAARAKVLCDLVEHHAKDEEEKEMFPKAKKVLSRDQLKDLGRRMMERKRELMAEVE